MRFTIRPYTMRWTVGPARVQHGSEGLVRIWVEDRWDARYERHRRRIVGGTTGIRKKQVGYRAVHEPPLHGAEGSTKRLNQNRHLSALGTIPGVRQHLGHHIEKEVWCATCRELRTTYEVQMTDVNIALQMLCDAEDDRFDAAILVSGDSDLVGPVKTVLERHPDKQVLVAFPPRRNSVELEKSCVPFSEGSADRVAGQPTSGRGRGTRRLRD